MLTHIDQLTNYYHPIRSTVDFSERSAAVKNQFAYDILFYFIFFWFSDNFYFMRIYWLYHTIHVVKLNIDEFILIMIRIFRYKNILIDLT